MPTSSEVSRLIRESLGIPTKPETQPTMPQEGHVCDFPIWSYSKQRSTLTTLRISYEDGSFFQLEAPKGMPSCNGLQSKRAGPALSAFSGPHYAPLSLPAGPH
jgi:hypothetical protein